VDKKPQLGAWLSFADAHRPKGHMFLGIVIVKADDPNAAVARVIELGLWPENVPGLDVEILPVNLNDYQPGEIDRMLDRTAAEQLGVEVTVRKNSHGITARDTLDGVDRKNSN
jgi:hypothetical protein